MVLKIKNESQAYYIYKMITNYYSITEFVFLENNGYGKIKSNGYQGTIQIELFGLSYANCIFPLKL
jgi:hypothetical protein